MTEQPHWLRHWHTAISLSQQAPLWVSLPQPDSVAAMVERVHAAQANSPSVYRHHRCWTLLLWQPVYASLAAVHDAHALLPLDGLQQSCQHGSVYGLRELPVQPSALPLSARIIEQGRYLQQFAQQAQILLQRLLPLKSKSLWGLLADLLWLGLQAGWHAARDADAWYSHGQDWQQAVLAQQPVAGRRDLIFLNQQQGWRMQRGSCCFHYLTQDGELCEGCPKAQHKTATFKQTA